MKTNLKTKSDKIYQPKNTKSKLPKQIYQTKHTKSDLLNQTYQTKRNKPKYQTEPNILNQSNKAKTPKLNS